MKILISPAKTFRKEQISHPAMTGILFPGENELLHQQLKLLKVQDWQDQFHVSEKVAKENVMRMENESDRHPALAYFHGEAFRHIGAESFSEQDWEYAQRHLCILSAYYGLLRPLDGISAYRLDPMDKAGQISPLKLWQPLIDDQLKGHPVVMLCSMEYAAMTQTEDQIYIQFMKNGKKASSMEAKKMRGKMVRQIIEDRIEDREKIKDLVILDYHYDASRSTGNVWYFVQGE